MQKLNVDARVLARAVGGDRRGARVKATYRCDLCVVLRADATAWRRGRVLAVGGENAREVERAVGTVEWEYLGDRLPRVERLRRPDPHAAARIDGHVDVK